MIDSSRDKIHLCVEVAVDESVSHIIVVQTKIYF